MPSAYENELKRIESIYHEHKGRYGYHRIHLALINEGIKLNHKTVQRFILKEILNHRDRMKNG